MSPDEQRLAEYLKRAVPEPPVWLSPEEITVQQADRSRKSWAMPVLAAAAVVAIGVGIGAVATHHPATRPPASSSVADQGSTGPADAASAHPTPSCQARGASVTVPSVVGMNFTQAEQILVAAGFNVTVRTETPVGQSAPAGTVILQAAPGTQLPRGAVIELTVSAGSANWRHFISKASSTQAAVPSDCPASATPSVVPTGAAGATVAVPSVIGMTELQAAQVLQTAGFNVDILAEMPVGRSVPTGEVWSQTPPAGGEVSRGTTITIDVASPPSNRA
jgi:hypothetical protein